MMDITEIITFLVICGIVWGGFIFFLFKAIKNEKQKA
jgi:hypothetical protein